MLLRHHSQGSVEAARTERFSPRHLGSLSEGDRLSGSPAQSRRHRPLQDSPAAWVLCALSLMEVSAGASIVSGNWRSLVGTPSSQAAPSPSSELCKREPHPLQEPLF